MQRPERHLWERVFYLHTFGLCFRVVQNGDVEEEYIVVQGIASSSK